MATYKKRVAIVAFILLACAFLVAYLVPGPIAHFVSTICLTNYVMLSTIILIADIFQV